MAQKCCFADDDDGDGDGDGDRLFDSVLSPNLRCLSVKLERLTDLQETKMTSLY
jgi:hypothetical protein